MYNIPYAYNYYEFILYCHALKMKRWKMLHDNNIKACKPYANIYLNAVHIKLSINKVWF